MNTYAKLHFKYKQMAENSKGYQYFQGINLYKFEIAVLGHNYQDLQKSIKSCLNAKSIDRLFNHIDPIPGRAILAKLSKCFNNYICSSVGMADRCGVLMKKYFPKNINDSYKRKISTDLADRFEVVLIRDLRHYLSHYHLPFARPTITTAKRTPQLYLNSEDLLCDSYKWSPLVKTRLEDKFSGSIDIKETINTQNDIVTRFNDEALDFIIGATKEDVEQYRAYRRASVRSMKLA